MRHYDTCLPQFDEDPRSRRLELECKQLLYEYAVNSPGLPAQVKNLPEDECFSDSYKVPVLYNNHDSCVNNGDLQWDIVSNKLQFIKDRKLISVTSGVKTHWESWEDLYKLYKYSMDVPLGAKDWTNDLRFGIQRIQGCNPVLISLCQHIPLKYALLLPDLPKFFGVNFIVGLQFWSRSGTGGGNSGRLLIVRVNGSENFYCGSQNHAQTCLQG